MERRFQELHDLRAKYNAEIFYGGDIFHTCREPSELVNFAIKYLPEGFAIPGQHDLPYHRYADIKKSPYWTLVESARLINIAPGQTRYIRDMNVTGFPWGTKLAPNNERSANRLEIALVHHYVWSSPGTGYAGAPEHCKAENIAKQLEGYDIAAFGDNHKMHYAKYEDRVGSPTILNPGCFISQKSDERQHDAWCGLVCENGTVLAYPFDNSQDKWLDVVPDDERFHEMDVKVEQVIQEITQFASSSVDFYEAVKRMLNGDQKVRDSVKEIILRALEDSQ